MLRQQAYKFELRRPTPGNRNPPGSCAVRGSVRNPRLSAGEDVKDAPADFVSLQRLVRGALCLAAFAGVVSAQSVAVLAGAQGTSTSIPVFSANPVAPVSTTDGVPAGAFQLLAKPDGSKFYLLTTSAGLTVLDRNFRNPVQT